MATVDSIRQFHTGLCVVCDAFEGLFELSAGRHQELEAVAAPLLERFRELLDAGDSIAGPDS